MDGNLVGKTYIGGPIDQESERKFLASTVRWLVEKQVPFVILANFHLGGRQLDCVVATASAVSVVEVKSSYLPIRGDLNGTWTRLHSSGEWRPYTNAYQQALAAKNALRDAMTNMRAIGNFYPDGHVVFTSGFAEDSQVTKGDFKVRVSTLSDFLSSFTVQAASPWSLSDWQAFATKLQLTPISLNEALAPLIEREAAELFKQYNSAFELEYARDASRWLPENAEKRCASFDAATAGAGCFITGPSGCGKTLMAKWIAVELAKTQNPSFFFAAKDFTGSWSDFIRREIGLFSDRQPSVLLKAVSHIDRPIFLILDGINELGSHRTNALRGIRALARRLGAKLIITSQEEKPPEFEGLRSVQVERPSHDLKLRIAKLGGVELSRTAIEVLQAVGSGIEAEIVGRVGAELKANATRLILLDQYIRMRLGEHARVAAFGLRRLAGLFHERVAFSVSETEFDEFMRVQAVDFGHCDALFAAALLIKRAGRISFSHEMIQNACAAFDIARNAAIDPATFAFRLSTPILEGIAGDILSAIEDAPTCRAILKEVTSPALLSDAADGRFGVIAVSIARAVLSETTEACVAEIRRAKLVLLQENDAVRVDWAQDFRQDWTQAERARLYAIGNRAAPEGDLGTYLRLCAEMDERLTSERQRLAEVAREAKFPIKSESFALAYYDFGTRIGFTHVASLSREYRFRHVFSRQSTLREGLEQVAKLELSVAKMSSGQLHFFLENRHVLFGDDDAERFAEELIYLFHERFRWEPYHVQLAALHAVGFTRPASCETLKRLVESIQALDVTPTNWAIKSSIIDALKILGALDDEAEENREQIKHELASVLGDDEEMVDKDWALSICLRMFDHPFDTIYAEEIFALDEALRRRLYRRALSASDIKSCASLSWLSKQIASFEDASDAPLMRRLATLPDPSNPFAQEEWGGFVVATRFLGRHGAELPRVEVNAPKEHCLTAVRTLVYAAESQRQRDMEDALQAWQRLHSLPAQLVIGCLAEVHAALTDWHWSESNQSYKTLDLVEAYSVDCLKAARCFVEDGLDAQYFHRARDREKGLKFAFDIIGRFGDRSDIDLLRRLSRAHPFARFALMAIKSIDAVSTTAS